MMENGEFKEDDERGRIVDEYGGTLLKGWSTKESSSFVS